LRQSGDTPAAGARLRIDEERILARCRGCSRVFTAEVDDYTCPRCGRADTDIEAGRDVMLVHLQGERLEETVP